MVSRYGEFPAVARYAPMLGSGKGRVVLGLVLLLASFEIAATALGCDRSFLLLLLASASWLISVLVTHKYVHKYPQRYLSYLVASHGKAAIIMAVLLLILSLATRQWQQWALLCLGGALFFCLDLLASSLRCHFKPGNAAAARGCSVGGGEAKAPAEASGINSRETLVCVRSALEEGLALFVEQNVRESEGEAAEVLVCDPQTVACTARPAAGYGLIAASVRMNDVRRMNRFLLDCASRLSMGGYFVCRYTPYEAVLHGYRERYPNSLYRFCYLLHFVVHRGLPKIPYLNSLYFTITNGKNRVFSKVELWGRLSYCGFHVVAETAEGGDRFLIAKKISPPSGNPRPSYYPVVALEKVGLDGEIVRLHKVRSMYPFSEFLQKRIFEDNGLASTGKFANDFRLTEYGNFIRRYWIDELPQIWDWLRGDIKLVGMRATSRHYLSLYPQELYDLYIQIKPGLIPPIFDEKTDSFDRIVEVEMAYLTSYMKSPLKTDVGLFFRTFTDIFFRGVRSK